MKFRQRHLLEGVMTVHKERSLFMWSVLIPVKSLYLFRSSSRISAPLLLLLSCAFMDCSAPFTSETTDWSQLFRRLKTQTQIYFKKGVSIFEDYWRHCLHAAQNNITSLSSLIGREGIMIMVFFFNLNEVSVSELLTCREPWLLCWLWPNSSVCQCPQCPARSCWNALGGSRDVEMKIRGWLYFSDRFHKHVLFSWPLCLVNIV